MKKNNRHIEIKGARVHNLKNISVTIPRNQLVVVTGVSGSGKSSLTIDTLFAEGQRRYAESLSAYARQFLQRMDKPDVDAIQGLCPAIAIEQKVVTRTPRSTVGSMTELYDYFRLLFARIGKTYSPVSGDEVKKHDVQDVVDYLVAKPVGLKCQLLAPILPPAPGTEQSFLEGILQRGFARLHVNGTTQAVEELLESIGVQTKKNKKPTPTPQWAIVIDRLVTKHFDQNDLYRLADSIATAFDEGGGQLELQVDGVVDKSFNRQFTADGILFEEPIPNLFSFNNPYGACPTCEGFSQILGVDPELVIPNPNLSLYEDAVAPWKGEKLRSWKEAFIRKAEKFQFPIHKPIRALTEKHRNLLWEGNQEIYGIHDFFKEVEQNLYKVQYRVLLSRYRGKTTCPDCNGFRLRKEALYIKIRGKHIGECATMTIDDLSDWLKAISWTAPEQAIAQRVLDEIRNRLQTMQQVGLGYLTMDRLANTLSGGESQRIQLTRSLGSNLTQSLYILDEPSIGLHSRDTENLIRVLKSLRDLGNTVVVVEHDEQMMREADHIIDMGPLASHLGGEVVAVGNATQISKNKQSLTGQYLSGIKKIVRNTPVRKPTHFLHINGATANNLKSIDVAIPLQVICAVSGVSGSGKSTLVGDILYPALLQKLGDYSIRPGQHNAIDGDWHLVQRVEWINQHPIGRSSRSNPVTYIKAYDEIRDLFSRQPLSKMRGYQPKHFSFNVDGGRCDACKGEGEQIVEMQFLADVHLPCEACGGKRFKEEILEVRFQEKNIHELLELSVDEAISFFRTDSKQGSLVAQLLQPLTNVGLGYVKLGQSSSTLSGGEAQRVKLASFLGKGKAQGSVFFIFDEPTTGLHFHDIHKLLDSFHALVEQGHTVLVVEHNTDVLRTCDWMIDLGPDAGINGGHVVYEGPPAGIKQCKKSVTARYL
ncbi:MAG: excinuclease ABC subunit UvrA [Ferruginibacter sp.]